jgi:DNA-binding NarL/FixJ family response regulator
MPSATDELHIAGTPAANGVAYTPLPRAADLARVPDWLNGGAVAPALPLRPGPTIALALIGGQRMLREATAGLLAAQDGLDVLGTFDSASHFLAARWGESPPAVLLFDCDDVDPEGRLQAVQRLCATRERFRLVLLCRETCAEVMHCAIEHRLSGVLLKSCSAEDLGAALAYTASGRTVLPAGWQQAASSPCPHEGPGLSPRHRQILALIARGRRNGEIANELALSPNTVKFHVRALYARIGVRNRVEAANQYAQMTSDST